MKATRNRLSGPFGEMGGPTTSTHGEYRCHFATQKCKNDCFSLDLSAERRHFSKMHPCASRCARCLSALLGNVVQDIPRHVPCPRMTLDSLYLPKTVEIR